LQAISLLADIRNGKYKGDTSLRSISLFLSFYPQSISGPIHRPSELIPQFSNTRKFNTDNLIIGFKTLLWGYFCKLIIADKIALIISPVFISIDKYDGLVILISTIFYSFQIYFDFWGYSLIAIGLGRILGFTININFLNPYSVISFKEFWHRWHVTLSKWMKDYIYISLGGRNQKNYSSFTIAILVTFLISGFWHGATLNFFLWGATHAFLYLSEDLISKHISFDGIRYYKILIKPIQRAAFIILISFTWLIFRTDTFQELAYITSEILLLSKWNMETAIDFFSSTNNLTYLTIIIPAISIAQKKIISQLTDKIAVKDFDHIVDTIFISICLLILILLGDIGGQEFLYFRF
jgi:D-alanyl-lipoteichoic acid acyltransferase DltB (MBOAT superfamily)